MFARFLSPKLALFFLIIFSVSIVASSQDMRATLLGVVTDKTGAAITNATITATAQATGLKWAAATDGEGRYRIPLLPSGSYALTVEAAQFASQTQTDLILRVGEERRVDVVLSAGQIEAGVTVTAPLTDSAATTLSAVVPEERVASLPLNGRQLQELALTVPGVSAGGGFRSDAFNQFGLATPTDGNAGAFTVNGAPSRANGFFLDGVDINIPEQGVIAFPPLVESVREFQAQTSLFNAEYGRFSGSIVNIVTKSGANDWRGSVYEYFRNDKLDANNFFNNANRRS